MFFGLTNVLTICQELINNILQKHLNIFVIAYLNNILVYFKTKKKYIKYINIVLELLMQRNLLFKSKKYKFHKKKMNFSMKQMII